MKKHLFLLMLFVSITVFTLSANTGDICYNECYGYTKKDPAGRIDPELAGNNTTEGIINTCNHICGTNYPLPGVGSIISVPGAPSGYKPPFTSL